MAVVLYVLLLERKQRRRLEQQVAALTKPSSMTRYLISHPIPSEPLSLSRGELLGEQGIELPGDRGIELPGDRGIQLPDDPQIPEMQ